MTDSEPSIESNRTADLHRQSLLAMYEECGAHMRFYAEARFKIMTVAITLVSTIIAAQEIIPNIGSQFGLILGLIGLVSTIVLFSLEYRYTQAWLTLAKWAEQSVEDELLGEGEGPLNSYRDVPKPWYILKSKMATHTLYFSLTTACVANVGYYAYQLALP